MAVDFRRLLRNLVRVLFEQKEIRMLDIMRHLEGRYRNEEYFMAGRKLYRGRGYKRVMELLQALKLLGILNN